jgi:CubicO group peptidase (beta-lactamase class C family)
MSSAKDLDSLLQKFVDDGLPGCGLQITKKEQVLYEGYFGWSNIKEKKPVTRDSVFRQASLTKVSMYTAAMILYERGKFLMTDPLYDYFPEWRHTMKTVYNPNGDVDVVPLEHPITIKNIMNMTCGLPYDMIMGDTPVRHPTSEAMAKAMKPLREKGDGFYTLREQIRAMSDVPVAFEPGTRWLYGFASELTAGLIAEICGKTAEDAIREMLFEPLHMDSTANYLFGDMAERLVTNYYIKPDGTLDIYTAERDAKFVGPNGTVSGFQRVATTVSDYSKLMQLLANGGIYRGTRLIGRKTIDLIRENTLSSELISEDFSNTYLAGYGYGYGMRTLMDKYIGQHNGSIGAFGWTGGSGTWAEADPGDGVSIVYMHNIQPNLEVYHHLRMRAAAYGFLE